MHVLLYTQHNNNGVVVNGGYSMVSITISMPSDRFGDVSIWQSNNTYKTFSGAASQLIKLGLIYSTILEEEECRTHKQTALRTDERGPK